MTHLSVYRNTKDTVGTRVTLDTVIRRIRTGARSLDEKTRISNALAITEPKQYKAYKDSNLPAVTFSGIFAAYKRKAHFIETHSGLITLDIDGLTAEQIADLLAELAQMPQVVLAFVSPSGLGIKVIVRVDPIPRNDLEHKGAYQACLEFFGNLAEEYGFTIDTSGKDCSRLCFLAHDPLAIFHTDTPAIDWDKDAWITEQKEKQERFEADAQIAYTGEADVKAIDFIDPNDLDYNQWLSVLTACKRAGLSVAQADAWSRRGGVRYQEGEVETRWNGLNLDVSWGAVVNLAKSNGYTPPTRTRYTMDPNHEHDTSDIDTERSKNLNAVTQWLQETENPKGKHLLILGSAAGTGKTTATITTASKLLYIAKTTEEADEVFAELQRQEQDAIRHRPRMFNRYHKDFDGNEDWHTLPLGLGDHDRPCIEPELCDLHAEGQGTPNAICQRCPLYTECKEKGYHSQDEIERTASKVVYAWSEVMACDKNFAERVKRICTKDDILIGDEVNPLSLTQHRILNRDTLYDLTERFRHPHERTASIFGTLKALLDHISTAETPETFIEGVKDWIDSIENITELDKTLETYPIGVVVLNTPETAEHGQPFEARLDYQGQSVTVPVVDFDTEDDTHAFYIGPETPIETETYHVRFVSYSQLLKLGLATLDNPPRRHRHLFRDLKTFIDENADLLTAPFTFDAKTQHFEFHLKPTLNHRRVVFNTASDPDNLIGEAYRETDITVARHIGRPPAWKTDLVFQISSGNYLPRHSLIKYGEDKTIQLEARAQELIDGYIIPSIEAGLKTLVIAPKAFQEVETVKHWAVTELDDYREGHTAILTNHHRAEGRNNYQDCDIVFTFHHEPDHHAIQNAAKRIYRNPETPLDFTREKRTVTVGGVRFKKVIYKDPRVQAVYNRECRSRLMQSGMRLRPNIHADKIIVYLTAEPVDIPLTPTPFTPQDAKHFTGDWTAFQETLHTIATATEQGDVKALTEASGQSKRTAERHTKEARDQQTADRDAEIHRRHAFLMQTQQEIATALGIRLATVNKVLQQGTQTKAERTAEIIRRADAGETYEDIVDALDVSRSTVARTLRYNRF